MSRLGRSFILLRFSAPALERCFCPRCGPRSLLFCGLGRQRPAGDNRGTHSTALIPLHVHNCIGEVVGFCRVAKDGLEHVPLDVPCFSSRLRSLSRALKLGALHFGLSFSNNGDSSCPIGQPRTHQLAVGRISAESQSHCWRETSDAHILRQKQQLRKKHELRGPNGSMNRTVTK